MRITGVNSESSRVWRTFERFASVAISRVTGPACVSGERRKRASEKEKRREGLDMMFRGDTSGCGGERVRGRRGELW